MDPLPSHPSSTAPSAIQRPVSLHPTRTHRRRKSQPFQMSNPNKFDQMYQQHLQHYTRLFAEGGRVQGEEGQMVEKRKQNSGEVVEGEGRIRLGVMVGREQEKKEEDKESDQLMRLLKGLGMDGDLLAEVIQQCQNLPKQC